VSQSPETPKATPADLRRYEDSWEAIYNLIDEGASWSGHERNCTFLNTLSPVFANVSASTGLDFPDDSRAVAMVDWDLDGRLDIWLTNRTAPRVRFLHNRSRSAHHYVMLRLQGTTANRDAVGARVELLGADGARLVRTLHAGDGYLSQSSKWLHFGLGMATDIQKATVRWPGGTVETFTGVTADSRLVLVQGTGLATTWTPPRGGITLLPGPLELPSRPDQTRTWISGRVPFPATHYLGWDATEKSLDAFKGRPLLINLWSHHCGPCQTELASWKNREDVISAAGLTILTLCVDEEKATRASAAQDAQNRRWASGLVSPAIVTAFETVSRSMLESRQPLPVPVSILLDAKGHTAALYKGSLTAEQLLADLALLDASPDQQRAASLPFTGRWATPPLTANPRQIVGTLMKGGRTSDARDYALRCLSPESQLPLPLPTKASLTLFLGDLEIDAGRLDSAVALYRQLLSLAPADPAIHREASIRLIAKQRVTDAIPHLEKTVALAPTDTESRLNLASLLLRENRNDRAIEHFRTLAAQLPQAAAIHFYLANALQSSGRTAEAVASYRAAHQLKPGSPATNNLAWILATSHDDTIRHGSEALSLAEIMCQKNGRHDPKFLQTLAAAQAETGQFNQAVTTAETALALAADQIELKTQLTQNLNAFKTGRPIRK
jgi:tetratricopeptide (TPR) repeat protein/thiol-disulfide isomerase/thioredoxin